MKHTGDEQPLFNDPEQLHSEEHLAVPASLLPSVLSRLGLADKSSSSNADVDEQLAALSHQDIALRVAAVRSLEEQREARTIGPLVAALHDSAWEVRAAAVWALGKFGEQAPVEALMGALADEDSSVRAAALRTVGQLRHQGSMEPLIQALDDPAWHVREIAVLTLGERGEQAPRALLAARLNDEHASVRQAASMALEQAHPDALSQITSEPIMSAPEPGADTVFSEEPAAPGTEGEIEAQPPFFDDEVSNIPSGKPAARNARRQPVRSKSGRLRPLIEGVLAALLIVGLAISWLVIEHGHHPSQGSATTPLLAYHGHVDGSAVWSSDSQYVSFLADSTPAGETVLVWQRATGLLTKHLLHTLLPQSQEHQVIFAPDGKYLAFVERDASNEEAVQVWDIISWRRIVTTTSPNSFLNILWSPDSTRIVIPTEEGIMHVWNIVTGHEQVVCHVPPVEYMTESSLISPDGLHVLFGYSSQNTYILDLTTCKLLILPPNGSYVLAWSPQGNRFATIPITDANMAQLWDAQTVHNLWSIRLPAPATNIVWTPDGTRLVISGDKWVEVVDVATKRIVLKVTPTSSSFRFQLARAVWALSPDGARLASLSGADTVQLWDVVTGSKLQQTYQNQGGSVNVVAWSPDSRSIATGSIDGTVRIWRGDTAPETFHSASTVVLNIAWSPDGQSITAGDFDGSMWVWHVS
jgi:WD40 repeat protein